MIYYDAHTHLNDDKLFMQRDLYTKNFINIGWKWLVNIGINNEWNQRAIDIAIAAEQYFPSTRVKATIGYHPSEVCFGRIITSNTAKGIGDINTIPDSDSGSIDSRSPQLCIWQASSESKKWGIFHWQSLQQSIQSLKDLYSIHARHIVAIGECGIDTHYDGDPYIDLQKELFAQQCDLAQELNLPIVIHSRDDFAATFDIAKNYKNQKIYFHCRGYGPEQIEIIQDFFPNLWIGFCGNITYPKSQMLRDSFLKTNKNSIVLETDAPYLSPQKNRWNTNTPSLIAEIYDYTAAIRSIDSFERQSTIAENIKNLYNIK
jgi:TatD DNase family protein